MKCRECSAELEQGVLCETCTVTLQPADCTADGEDYCGCGFCLEIEVPGYEVVL